MILKLNMLLLTAVSAWMDLKWWKVKNAWLLLYFAGGVIFNISSSKSGGPVLAAAGILIPFCLLFPLYRLGKMGAGDVKLFCTAGCWLGGERIPEFMFWAFLSGTGYFLLLMGKERSILKVLKKKSHVAVWTFVSTLCLIGGLYG